MMAYGNSRIGRKTVTLSVGVYSPDLCLAMPLMPVEGNRRGAATILSVVEDRYAV